MPGFWVPSFGSVLALTSSSGEGPRLQTTKFWAWAAPTSGKALWGLVQDLVGLLHSPTSARLEKPLGEANEHHDNAQCRVPRIVQKTFHAIPRPPMPSLKLMRSGIWTIIVSHFDRNWAITLSKISSLDTMSYSLSVSGRVLMKLHRLSSTVKDKMLDYCICTC